MTMIAKLVWRSINMAWGKGNTTWQQASNRRRVASHPTSVLKPKRRWAHTRGAWIMEGSRALTPRTRGKNQNSQTKHEFHHAQCGGRHTELWKEDCTRSCRMDSRWWMGPKTIFHRAEIRACPFQWPQTLQWHLHVRARHEQPDCHSGWHRHLPSFWKCSGWYLVATPGPGWQNSRLPCWPTLRNLHGCKVEQNAWWDVSTTASKWAIPMGHAHEDTAGSSSDDFGITPFPQDHSLAYRCLCAWGCFYTRTPTRSSRRQRTMEHMAFRRSQKIALCGWSEEDWFHARANGPSIRKTDRFVCSKIAYAACWDVWSVQHTMEAHSYPRWQVRADQSVEDDASKSIPGKAVLCASEAVLLVCITGTGGRKPSRSTKLDCCHWGIDSLGPIHGSRTDDERLSSPSSRCSDRWQLICKLACFPRNLGWGSMKFDRSMSFWSNGASRRRRVGTDAVEWKKQLTDVCGEILQYALARENVPFLLLI